MGGGAVSTSRRWGEDDMRRALVRLSIEADLRSATHRAGRWLVGSSEHTEIHHHIDALLEKWEGCTSRPDEVVEPMVGGMEERSGG